MENIKLGKTKSDKIVAYNIIGQNHVSVGLLLKSWKYFLKKWQNNKEYSYNYSTLQLV